MTSKETAQKQLLFYADDVRLKLASSYLWFRTQYPSVVPAPAPPDHLPFLPIDIQVRGASPKLCRSASRISAIAADRRR